MFMIAAFICFVLATAGVGGRFNLLAAGFAILAAQALFF